jgi:hypothetical protein
MEFGFIQQGLLVYSEAIPVDDDQLRMVRRDLGFPE